MPLSCFLEATDL